MMKSEQENVRTLLLSTIAQLCQNGLIYKKDLRVQGLLAITIDGSDILVVQLNENIEAAEADTSSASSVEMAAAVAAIASKDFPVPIGSCEMQNASQAGATSELALGGCGGGQIDMDAVTNCKTKTVPSYIPKSAREPPTFGHEGDHNKMAEQHTNIEYSSTLVDKDAAADNTSMLLPPFSIPMTVNYSSMKAFQGSECYRDPSSDQIDYVFPDFQAPTTAMTGDPGRLTCQVVSANSGPSHGQPEFSSNIGSAQSYQQFSSMISTPQVAAKLDMAGVGKRILPHATGHFASFAGQGQVKI